jgi:orotate phosphoribosyltransferase
MSLFQLGDFTLHTGGKSDLKIDCDALTDDDITVLAHVIQENMPPFSTVVGIPKGGLRLANALQQYTKADANRILIVDDVLTTGRSMREAYTVWKRDHNEVIGCVIFARGPLPVWLEPVWIDAVFKTEMF